MWRMKMAQKTHTRRTEQLLKYTIEFVWPVADTDLSVLEEALDKLREVGEADITYVAVINHPPVKTIARKKA